MGIRSWGNARVLDRIALDHKEIKVLRHNPTIKALHEAINLMPSYATLKLRGWILESFICLLASDKSQLPCIFSQLSGLRPKALESLKAISGLMPLSQVSYIITD